MSIGTAAFNFTRLSGTWINELSSVLVLHADKTGGLTGTYNSAVGTAEDEYIVTGRFDTTPPAGEGVALGWVVAWKNKKLDAHSATGWSGQFYAGASHLQDTILTQWLLTSSTTPANNWESTNVGTDLFKPKAAVSGRSASEGPVVARFASPTPEQIVAKRSSLNDLD
ncbi:Structural origins of high-affinity biotin binding To Streptavidin [Mycena indigotica]|uniref:Structural origins of high-affinity biotin binding To Streptavidin n=1 Tax=Mycena indigotica TaxID=2126181 RepID=A0A8H6W325_9AGAR|nr:Structural origins of high-affinity biotin binding To Streptavidin [Mycena indigotica]KAF7297534.1 Structural origins of high-affinity biotin binding To Streptavidin [Mycena indigotica]